MTDEIARPDDEAAPVADAAPDESAARWAPLGPGSKAAVDRAPSPVPAGLPASDDLDTLLAEYNEKVSPPQEGTAEPEQSVTPEQPETVEGLIEQFSTRAELHEGKRKLLETALAMRQQLHQEREWYDVRQALDAARAGIPEFASLSDDTMLSLLVGIYQTDGKFARAWDRRWQDQNMFRGRWLATLGRLQAELRGRVDEDATETREAISHYMTHGRSASPPPRPTLPSNLSSMSDREFGNVLAEMGVDPQSARLF
jgi:hypothetical protein